MKKLKEKALNNLDNDSFYKDTQSYKLLDKSKILLEKALNDNDNNKEEEKNIEDIAFSKKTEEEKIESAKLRDTILNMAIESWRFASAYERILTKIDAGDQHRYYSQYRWFIKKIEECLTSINLQFLTVVGHEYETGMPVTPLNLEDFEENDTLIVEQMLEPIIIGKKGIVRPGTIILRKSK
ncbi:MAG: hypothetical protein LBE38_00785 [Deltaproteobacteria bacterium]|jgi:hypothetical protein|nr:hypothetical protein [Deltaproteobacteria bacterium]